MDFDEVERLRRNSAAWRLLNADNAALVLTFLGAVFVDENVRSISAAELAGRLEDELQGLNERFGQVRFPKSAKAYLEDWSRSDVGWLRKYYPPGSDEVHFDATPAVEKALAWVRSLQARAFVGTESRLNIIFELLRQMVFGAEADPDRRLAELYRRRGEIDAEIERVRAGDMTIMDASAQRDRYQQFTATARGLLADFREVEANFRALDRDLREQVALWNGSKGALLDEVLGSRNAIAESDQGRSFHAFYDFLLSQQRQAEFTDLLEQVQVLPAIEAADPRMRRIHYDWLDAGERTQATVRTLSEQLRRFLDDQVWLENRRVMDLLRGIEAAALRLRDLPTASFVMEIDAAAPSIALPMERPLYRTRPRDALDSSAVTVGDEVVDVSVLFEQVHVDPLRLSAGVREALRKRSQVGLAEIVGDRPLEQGLAELVTYLSLVDPAFRVVFDEARREQVQWTDADGRHRTATMPRVTFTRVES
ncbi:DUF3375 domain-containing protein [Virgisporangium aurantiacum]|uniref:DUF3375 domain-containing protein n=1 Tax=Virgisporangium aurantiacum TaxID=175570 RepID=A0A8J3Z9C1_9ACTN|nr:DUF3375 domain-containing protein [Virgisporangium aurantiacum]GIJ57630.1 hypothetical protein Vau01_051460 [Virgisporangium aurantiacum]